MPGLEPGTDALLSLASAPTSQVACLLVAYKSVAVAFGIVSNDLWSLLSSLKTFGTSD